MHHDSFPFYSVLPSPCGGRLRKLHGFSCPGTGARCDRRLCSSDSDCSDGEVCDPYLNEGQGGCAVCIADLSVCEGSKVKTCLPDGSGFADPVECIPADPCMVSEGCVDGACGEVTPKSCDDGDDCTADQCNGITGECVSLPGPFPGCCASDEDCDDGLSCTTDTCDTLNGICSNPGGPLFR